MNANAVHIEAVIGKNWKEKIKKRNRVCKKKQRSDSLPLLYFDCYKCNEMEISFFVNVAYLAINKEFACLLAMLPDPFVMH